MTADPIDPSAAVSAALLALQPGASLRIALAPTGEPKDAAWAAMLGSLPQALLDEHGWAGRAAARPAWLGRVGCTVEAALDDDACTLRIGHTGDQPPLVPPRLARLPALAVRLCALIDTRFGERSRVRAADPLTGGLSEAWTAQGDAGVDPSLTRPNGFREVRARIAEDAQGGRWLRWPWRGPETGLGGLVEVPLSHGDLPDPLLAEAVRSAAEALALQADADHTRRLSERDRRLLSAVLEMSHDGIIAATAEGDVVFYNDTLRDISSWTREEIVEQGWAPLVYPDPAYRARMLEWIRRHFVGEQFEAQSVSLARRDGSRRSCLLRTRVTHDERGVAVAMGAFRDVTALLEAEAQRARQHSLEGLERLAGTVAHDFRNLLAGIMGHANLIELDGGPPAERAARISAAAERGDAMTRRLLSFGGARPTAPSAVDARALVEDLVGAREAVGGGRIRFVVAAEPALPAAHADRGLLAEALENLLLNAEQASGGGEIRVELGLAVMPAQPSSGPPTLRGECVRIRVHDDGPGFTPEARAHLFEPFWTSRPDGHGIGLAAVRSLLSSLGGGVDVPGGLAGGVVDLLLPISTHAPEAPSTGPTAMPQGHEQIWVVDDEAELVELLTASLDMLGYRTRGFTRGAAVVAALEAGDRPDLFTLDVRMPEMDGATLHAELRQRGVRAPVLFCSGMAGVELPNDDRVALLEKPFKLAQLAEQVRRLIDRWVLVPQPVPRTTGG